jgi:hypothetical protein
VRFQSTFASTPKAFHRQSLRVSRPFAAKPLGNRIVAHRTLKEFHSSTSTSSNLVGNHHIESIPSRSRRVGATLSGLARSRRGNPGFGGKKAAEPWALTVERLRRRSHTIAKRRNGFLSAVGLIWVVETLNPSGGCLLSLSNRPPDLLCRNVQLIVRRRASRSGGLRPRLAGDTARRTHGPSFSRRAADVERHEFQQLVVLHFGQ